MPRVSVLLTTYNRPGMLAEAVQSVYAQTMDDYELIILDDNSSDGAQQELLRGCWNSPRTRIYKDDVRPQERASRTRYAHLANIGLQLARGRYITYLCDDDLFLPRRLEIMAGRLDRGDCHVVYGAQRLQRDGADIGVRPASGVLHDAYCIVDHSSVMHTAQAAKVAGGWDDDPAHWHQADAQFWRRLTAAGYLFHPVDEITDIHRFHDRSVQSAGIPR